MVDDNAYGLSKRKVTLSTSGIVPKIDELSKVTDIALTISLHAPNDELRNELVPINKKYPIQELLDSVNRYVASCNDKRVTTIEYILIDGINDGFKNWKIRWDRVFTTINLDGEAKSYRWYFLFGLISVLIYSEIKKRRK